MSLIGSVQANRLCYLQSTQQKTVEVARLRAIWLIRLLGLDACGSRHPYCDILRHEWRLRTRSMANSDGGHYISSVYLVQSLVLDWVPWTTMDIAACFGESFRLCDITININEYYVSLSHDSCKIMSVGVIQTKSKRSGSATGPEYPTPRSEPPRLRLMFGLQKVFLRSSFSNISPSRRIS